MSVPAVRHCAVCGARVIRTNSTYHDVRAYCRQHNDLPALDMTPDEREDLPMQAADFGEALQTAREREGC